MIKPKWGGYKIPALKEKCNCMRRAAKIDENQPEIVDALRSMGCSVTILSAVGNGCPDILVGFRGTNLLFEIKDGKKPKSKRQLTSDQVKWHTAWNGKVYIVESVEQAITIINDPNTYI